MAVGPDEMVDLEFLQDRTNQRAAPRPGGIDFVERGESAKNSDERPVKGDTFAQGYGVASTPAARESA